MTKKHMKKCLPSLAIKEIQINTTLRFHLIPNRIAIIKNTTNVVVLVRLWGKRKPGTLLVGMQASVTTLENNMEAS
jgi:hypothetical protein